MKQSRRQNSQDYPAAEENLKAMNSEESSDKVADDSDMFVSSISKITEGAADTVIVSAKETIDQATQAYKSARLAYEQAIGTYKSALETIAQTRSSAKDVMGKVRANPKPFFQAIVPGAVGAFLLFEKTRDGYRAQRSE